MNHAITIADVAIRTDADGRYCLNDLHRASGSEKRHGPSYWLTNAQTRALVEEIGTTGIPAVASTEGSAGGTYVAKELVYAYAMWISPSFHLRVIRAYDAMVTAPPTPVALPDFTDPAAAARAWADQVDAKRHAERKVAQLSEEVAEAQPKLLALQSIHDAAGSMTMTEAAKTLQVHRSELLALLRKRRWIYRLRDGAPWSAYQERLDSGLLEHKSHVFDAGDSDDGDRVERVATQARVTGKGLVMLARILAADRITAKLAQCA
jgi:phage antirepressor YoqD-like protein